MVDPEMSKGDCPCLGPYLWEKYVWSFKVIYVENAIASSICFDILCSIACASLGWCATGYQWGQWSVETPAGLVGPVVFLHTALNWRFLGFEITQFWTIDFIPALTTQEYGCSIAGQPGWTCWTSLSNEISKTPSKNMDGALCSSVVISRPRTQLECTGVYLAKVSVFVSRLDVYLRNVHLPLQHLRDCDTEPVA